MKKGKLYCSTLSFPSNYKHNDTWKVKTWNGLADFNGRYVWSDGTHIYYSKETEQYVLNGDTWEPKTWEEVTPDAYNIWSDGDNIYLSDLSNLSQSHWVLNDGTWVPKTWNGTTIFSGSCVWSNGTNIFYSSTNNQYVLNGDTWEPKTWNNRPALYGWYIWSDGTHIYCWASSGPHVLNGDTWEPKTWRGIETPSAGPIWSDGVNIYYSNNYNTDEQYVLNGDTWEHKNWSGPHPDGYYIWSDGTNVYYSNGTEHYVLERESVEPEPTPFNVYIVKNKKWQPQVGCETQGDQWQLLS